MSRYEINVENGGGTPKHIKLHYISTEIIEFIIKKGNKSNFVRCFLKIEHFDFRHNEMLVNVMKFKNIFYILKMNGVFSFFFR